MILVTGATGTVSGEVARQLAERGVPVRAIVQDQPRAGQPELPGVEMVPGDLAHPESLDLPFRDVDGLFLASGPTLERAELEGNAIAAARQAGVRHIVKLSAIGAGPESPVQTLRLHAAVEEELRHAGLDWTILQPNFFMQRVLASAPSIIEEGAIRAPAGGGKASLVDARDVAAVAAEILVNHDHIERTLVLTGPEPLSHSEVAEMLTSVLDRTVTYVPVPPEAAREQMLDSGMPEWLADDFVTMLSVIYAYGYASPVTATVEEVTGEPPRSFETFAMEHADAFEQVGRAG